MQQLKMPSGLRDAWKRLLDLDPTSLDTARPAAIALSRLYEQAGHWRDLIDVLRKQVEWTSGPERKELLFRIGEIEQSLLLDPAAAVTTYREILENDAQETRALDALEDPHHPEAVA